MVKESAGMHPEDQREPADCGALRQWKQIKSGWFKIECVEAVL